MIWGFSRGPFLKTNKNTPFFISLYMCANMGGHYMVIMGPIIRDILFFHIASPRFYIYSVPNPMVAIFEINKIIIITFYFSLISV